MDSFLTACGADSSPRLAIQGGDHVVYALPQAFVLIGRSESCDIRIDHPDVRPRHAYLQMVQGRLAYFDLGTRDGLKYGQTERVKTGCIDHDVGLGIGPFIIRRVDDLHLAQSEYVSERDGTQCDEEESKFFLEVVGNTVSPHLWHLKHSVTLVGRSPLCQLRLPDVSVSWFHCSLVSTPQGIWVVDLMSRNGIEVNGRSCRCSRLAVGDELVLGRLRCIIQKKSSFLSSYARAESLSENGSINPGNIIGKNHHSLVHSKSSPKEAYDAIEIINPIESDIIALLSSSRTDTNNPAIVMLVERFGHIQQQMLEQFHQTMMMMMMNLDKAHQEELRHVKNEVEHLRELSKELLAIKEQLGERKSSLEYSQERIGESVQPLPSVSSATSRGGTSSKHRSVESMDIISNEPGPLEDPLVQVARRITQIREEQRTRLQRIFNMVRLR